MSLAPSVAVPRASFNPLPLYIALFCLLWSFAFVAGKIGVTDCPPLILLTARFSLAGILILGITALRGEAWSSLTWRDAGIFAILGVANNALYLGLGYTGLQTVSAGLGGLIVSANPVFTAMLAAAFLGEALTWRKVMGLLLGSSVKSLPDPPPRYAHAPTGRSAGAPTPPLDTNRIRSGAATATRRTHRRQTRSGLIVDPRHPFIRPAPPGGQAHGVRSRWDSVAVTATASKR